MRAVRARTAAVGICWLVLALPACTGATGAPTVPAFTPTEIAGGGTTGIYYGYGQELAGVLSRELGVPFTVRETAGSVENLRLIADGTALMGVAAADAASDAIAGAPPFDRPLPVQAVARVYDDVIHLVTAASSPVRTIDDLPGRTVSLGAPGSGTVLIAERLLGAAGIDRADVTDLGLGIDASIAAFREGTIEAFVWSGGLPTPGVADLAADMPIRLVPLDDLVDEVRGTHGPAYRHAIVPQGTYDIATSTATMAVPNYLVAHADADADLITESLRLLFANQLEMALSVPAVGLLDPRTAIFTAPVDLHPGAVRYYREAKGVTVTDDITPAQERSGRRGARSS